MEKIIDKISEYEIVNNIIPGAVYIYLLNHICTIQIKDEGVIQTIIMSYFIGVVIGRIGSLCMEPIMKKLKFISHADYSKFIDAEKSDNKIQILLRVANMYRTFMSMMLLILITKLLDMWMIKCPVVKGVALWVVIILGILLFFAAFAKQTKIIKKRVEKACEED